MQTNLQTTLKKKDYWIKTENDTKNQKPKEKYQGTNWTQYHTHTHKVE